MDLFAKRTFKLASENAFKISPHIELIEKNGPSVIRLNIGEPDFNTPDFIKDEIKKQLDLNNTHYVDPKGMLSLRQAIANQILHSRGLNISPEQVVVFPGAKPGIGFTEAVYCNPGDEIIYPSPGFPIYESFIQYLDAIPVPIHLSEKEGFLFSAEQLAEKITSKTKLIILNFPSNPTGGVANQTHLEKIADVILKKSHPNVRVYSDEIYENILFDNEKHFSIAALPEMAKRTIISSGFSKSYAWTGGRVGYAIFPTIEEANIFKNLNINYFSCVPPYNQMGAKVALEHPSSKEAVGKMVSILEERRNYIIPALHEIEGMSCQIPKGAFYVFPNIAKVCEKLGISEYYENLSHDLKQHTSPASLFQMFALYYHRVAVIDRRSFGMLNSNNEHYIRISFAADLTLLKEGVNRIKDASSDLQGFKKFTEELPPMLNGKI